MMSKPTTLAPPSMTAVNTRPISGVQVTPGLPSNGGVRNVSSSMATTTVGEDDGLCGSPKVCQRSMVRKWIGKSPYPIQRG